MSLIGESVSADAMDVHTRTPEYEDLYTRLLLVRRMLVVNERLLPTRVYFKMVLL